MSGEKTPKEKTASEKLAEAIERKTKGRKTKDARESEALTGAEREKANAFYKSLPVNRKIKKCMERKMPEEEYVEYQKAISQKTLKGPQQPLVIAKPKKKKDKRKKAQQPKVEAVVPEKDEAEHVMVLDEDTQELRPMFVM